MTCRAALAVVVVAAAGSVLLTGCTGGSAEGEPTRVDLERADVLRADPWLAPTFVETTRYAYGTNGQYEPGTAHVVRPLAGTAAQAVTLELEAAAAAGWWPSYVRCPGVESPADRTVDHHPDSTLVAVVVRELGDGSLAQAVIGAADQVEVVATVPNHAVPTPDPPREVESEEAACLSKDGSGPSTLGDPTDLTGW